MFSVPEIVLRVHIMLRSAMARCFGEPLIAGVCDLILVDVKRLKVDSGQHAICCRASHDEIASWNKQHFTAVSSDKTGQKHDHRRSGNSGRTSSRSPR